MTAARSDGSDDGPIHLPPRERYEKLLLSAEYNTGGPDTPMRAGIPEPNLLMIATAHGRYGGMEKSLRAAVENDDLLPWRDRDGKLRFTPTSDEALRDLIAEENARPDTSVGLIEVAVERIDSPVVDGGAADV